MIKQWWIRLGLQLPIQHMAHSNAHTLDLNAYWTDETLAVASRVEYYDLTFNHCELSPFLQSHRTQLEKNFGRNLDFELARIDILDFEDMLIQKRPI